MAAANLAQGNTRKEFTEWELSVEAWRLNKNRWGLRGFEQVHPDHKRVMMEIMGGGGLVKEGLLIRTRENHYSITSAGLARVDSLVGSRDTRQRSIHVYDDVSIFAFHRVFEAHLKDPTEPQTWLGAASFLNLQRNDPRVLEDQLSRVRDSIGSARKFMAETGRDELRRGDAARTITRERLDRLAQFVSILEERFQTQFDAIRSKAIS